MSRNKFFEQPIQIKLGFIGSNSVIYGVGWSRVGLGWAKDGFRRAMVNPAGYFSTMRSDEGPCHYNRIEASLFYFAMPCSPAHFTLSSLHM